MYDDARHLSIATLEGMRDRTVTISGASKTFSCTGWRIGYAIASPEITGAIRKVHDFLTVGAPHPLQEAVAMAMSFQDDFYEKLRRDYRERRQVIYEGLGPCGFGVGTKPGGAYYLMAGISSFGFPNDTDFARYLVEKVGVAVVPGSSFYNNPRDGYGHVRFAFCKKVETLREALGRLRKLEKPR